MFLCYVDESGTSDIPGNTSHFVLAGLSVPIAHWRECDVQIEAIKQKYDIADAEIHVAWLLRPYVEQNNIPRFAALEKAQRRFQVESLRRTELLRLQRSGNNKLYKQVKKNYKHTQSYIHLSFEERRQMVMELAQCVANWQFARLFAECVDKNSLRSCPNHPNYR